MKIKTKLLQEALSLLDKAAGKNKLIPITQMIGLTTEGTKLVLSTTDTFNFMYITKEAGIELPKLDVCTNLEIFNKLVNKITTEEVEFIVDGTSLTLKGNGEYKLELMIDEEGELFAFPKNNKEVTTTHKEVTLNVDKLDNVRNQCQKSLGTDVARPILSNYCLTKDLALSSDVNNITKVTTDLVEETIILPSKVVDLICATAGEVNFKHCDNHYEVTNGEVRLFTKVTNIEDYPSEAICNVLATDVDTTGTIDLTKLLQILERISIMISTYDNGTIKLEVAGETISISSLKASGIETLEYKGNTNTNTLTNYADVNSLILQLNTITKKDVTLSIKDGNFFAVESDDTKKLIAQTTLA